LAAVSLTLATQAELSMHPQFHAYLPVIFFAALFDYGFHRFITLYNKPDALCNEKYAWEASHFILLKSLIIISLIGLGISLFFVRIQILYLLVPLAILTFLYSIAIFKKNEVRFRLQEIPGLKIFLLAFVWSGTTVFIPVLQSGNGIGCKQVLMVFIERFTFIVSVAIPFDIRDMKADQLSGFRTIPIVLGVYKARLICTLALGTSLVVAILHYGLNQQTFIIPFYSVSIALNYYFITNKRLRKHPLYYHGILDGSIILHGLLIFGSQFLRM
jgi:4-hydroxybenzoate polyprenyltransferase